MQKFSDFLEEQLKDPEFRKEYEAIQPEMAVIRALVDARISRNLTKSSYLSERESIRQISVS